MERAGRPRLVGVPTRLVTLLVARFERLFRRAPRLNIRSTSRHYRETEASGVANIKSQIKRNRQNEKARMRNKAVKSSLKTAIRKFHAAADSGDVTTAGSQLRAASRALDKAVSKGIVHKNQAANRKSAIAKAYAKLATD